MLLGRRISLLWVMMPDLHGVNLHHVSVADLFAKQKEIALRGWRFRHHAMHFLQRWHYGLVSPKVRDVNDMLWSVVAANRGGGTRRWVLARTAIEELGHERRVGVSVVRRVEDDGPSKSHREVMAFVSALNAIALCENDVGSRHEHRTESSPQALRQRAGSRETKQIIRSMWACSLDEVINRRVRNLLKVLFESLSLCVSPHWAEGLQLSDNICEEASVLRSVEAWTSRSSIRLGISRHGILQFLRKHQGIEDSFGANGTGTEWHEGGGITIPKIC
jgi:hypothetical protein